MRRQHLGAAALVLACVLLGVAVACSSDSGAPQTAQQGANSQFCSDLGSLNIAVINMESLNPANLATNQNDIETSYDAVRREAASVPGVDMTALTDAYNQYSQAVQAAGGQGGGNENLASLKAPLANLQGAIGTTAKQANCPPLATPPAPTSAPAGAPTLTP
ncbi:MAG TPA: hypothetical protein VH951_02170 [Dehalococcoidia bacterium]